VSVNIVHTYRGDLQIDLVAPDGSSYRLKSSNRLDSADDVKATVTVDASAEQATGTWMLRVRDRYTGDTGVLNSWALTF
jgi:serine protease